jgi:DNA repair exonuclease SbcCD ATPase subunit
VATGNTWAPNHLDAVAQQLQRGEEQARLSALTPQLDALCTAIAAEEQALREARHVARVILDESFAALDPETLQRCLRCVLKCAATVLVIAHP